MFCVYCSKEMTTGSVLCGSCGNSLKERLLKCRNCGYQAIEGDRFCLRCSTEIEFMHVEKKEIRPALATPKAEQEIRHVPFEFYSPKAEPVIRQAPFKFPNPEVKEIKNAESVPMQMSSSQGDINSAPPTVGYVPEPPNPHISRERKPNRWRRFVVAWLIFILIVGGAALAVYLYFDEIMSFFQAENDTPIVSESIEITPHQVILPLEIQSFDEEPLAEPESEPVSQEPLRMISASTIAAGSAHYLVVSDIGNLWSWGANSSGQLGVGSTDDYFQPVLIMSNVVSVHAALDRTVVISEEGTLWGFGNNDRGQLGDGSTTNRYLPVRVLENVVFVSITDDTTFAITNDNFFWAWGANDEGQLGDGTTIDRLSPTVISSDGLNFAWENGLIDNYPPWHGANIAIEGEQVVSMVASEYASLVLTDGGNVWGIYGNAFDAIEHWDEYEYEFFIVMANVRLPTGQTL